jgi:hypothetical protein
MTAASSSASPARTHLCGFLRASNSQPPIESSHISLDTGSRSHANRTTRTVLGQCQNPAGISAVAAGRSFQAMLLCLAELLSADATESYLLLLPSRPHVDVRVSFAFAGPCPPPSSSLRMSWREAFACKRRRVEGPRQRRLESVSAHCFQGQELWASLLHVVDQTAPQAGWSNWRFPTHKPEELVSLAVAACPPEGLPVRLRPLVPEGAPTRNFTWHLRQWQRPPPPADRETWDPHCCRGACFVCFDDPPLGESFVRWRCPECSCCLCGECLLRLPHDRFDRVRSCPQCRREIIFKGLRCPAILEVD